MNRFIYFIIFFLLGQVLWAQLNEETIIRLIESKNYNTLEIKLEDYLAKSPKDYKMLEYLGDVYGYQNKWESASECYKKLVDTYPNNANYHFKYGGVLGKMAKERSKFKALKLIRLTKELFKKVESLDPNHIPVQWAQVQLYAELPGFLGGSYDISWGHAEQLEQLSKIDGYMAKVFILEKQNNKKLAKQYAEKIVLKHNDLPCLNASKIEAKTCQNIDNSQYYSLANAYILLGKDINVAEFFLKIYISKHTSRDRIPVQHAYLKLADINIKKNQKKLALEYLEKALNIDPDFDKAVETKEQLLKENHNNNSN